MNNRAAATRPDQDGHGHDDPAGGDAGHALYLVAAARPAITPSRAASVNVAESALRRVARQVEDECTEDGRQHDVRLSAVRADEQAREDKQDRGAEDKRRAPGTGTTATGGSRSRSSRPQR
jgi:hypothetical protein